MKRLRLVLRIPAFPKELKPSVDKELHGGYLTLAAFLQVLYSFQFFPAQGISGIFWISVQSIIDAITSQFLEE